MLLASTGLVGLVLTDSVLDAGSSSAVMTRATASSQLNTVLIGRLADGMERLIADEDGPMSRQQLLAAADEAFNEAPVRAATIDGLASAHTAAINGDTPPEIFHHPTVSTAARRALVASRPSLHQDIRIDPLVRIELPIAGLDWLAGWYGAVRGLSILALAGGVIGTAVAQVTASDRSTMLRSTGWWMTGIAAGWLMLGVIIVSALRMVVPSSFAALAAATTETLSPLGTPVLITIGVGLLLVAADRLIPGHRQRRGALILARAGTSYRDSRSPADNRLSAAWLEGHGYLDDERVAPFLTGDDRPWPDGRSATIEARREPRSVQAH